MARNLNKQPLNFEPMVALSADFRRKYGKEPDGYKVPETYKRLLGDSMPPGADLWRNYNGLLDAIESNAAEVADDLRGYWERLQRWNCASYVTNADCCAATSAPALG